MHDAIISTFDIRIVLIMFLSFLALPFFHRQHCLSNEWRTGAIHRFDWFILPISLDRNHSIASWLFHRRCKSFFIYWSYFMHFLRLCLLRILSCDFHSTLILFQVLEKFMKKIMVVGAFEQPDLAEILDALEAVREMSCCIFHFTYAVFLLEYGWHHGWSGRYCRRSCEHHAQCTNEVG